MTDGRDITSEITLSWTSVVIFDDKSTLPEPMLTQIFVAIWRH